MADVMAAGLTDHVWEIEELVALLHWCFRSTGVYRYQAVISIQFCPNFSPIRAWKEQQPTTFFTYRIAQFLNQSPTWRSHRNCSSPVIIEVARQVSDGATYMPNKNPSGKTCKTENGNDYPAKHERILLPMSINFKLTHYPNFATADPSRIIRQHGRFLRLNPDPL